MTMSPGPKTASKVRNRCAQLVRGPMSLDKRVPSAPRMPASCTARFADGRESSWVSIIGRLEYTKRCRFRDGQPERTQPKFGACVRLKEIGGIENSYREVRSNALPARGGRRSYSLRALSDDERAAVDAAPTPQSRATVQEASLALQKVYGK